MLPVSTTILNQIRFLLNGVNDSNFDSTSREFFQFAEHGSELSTLVLQTCLSELNSNGADAKNGHLIGEIVSSVFKFLLNKPNFCTVFCEAIRDQPLNGVFLEDLANKLNLSVAEKIGVGLALLESENIATRVKGHNFCITEINKLSASANIRRNQIEDIVLFIYQSDGLSKHIDTLNKILSFVPQDESFCIAANLILTDDISSINYSRQLDFFNESLDNDFEAILADSEQEISMPDILRELGYGCTFNIAHCKEILSFFMPLNEVTVSKLISTIARSRVGLDDSQNVYSSFCSVLDKNLSTDQSLLNSWNVDVLVDSIKQMAPKLNWTCVMEKLDHEGFIIPDETTFSLLISIYGRSCQAPFPLHAVCGSIWKNTEGQLSFLKHAVAAPPDIFSFSHCSRQLDYADIGHMCSENGNQAWSCLGLLDSLCQLAERGHARTVRSILEHPINHCPDILLLGITHINTAYNLIKHEVLSTVFPKILNDQTKSSVIRQLWQVDANLVLRGFTEVHTDPSNILRIADVCQELKILPAVLYSTVLPVSLRLAACAYSKEHAHLEKWLNESFNMYKDVFFEHCLAFLQEIFLHGTNDIPSSSLKKSQIAVLLVYQLACPIFLQVLQANSAHIKSQKLVDELKMLQTTSTTKSQSPSIKEPTNSEGNTDDIETEANAYFHQMFSGQLTIDAMVQMLARYKESPEKRDQSIFECMIANLFEEYKFFPKYPDKQLKLAAVLFGSLIKHQLVTHLALGIALRGVLDSLRKSTDSKMFMFGTKALEQFIDRLVEWPQYCNHILQISHLRTTHPEMVSVIERELARISSSQTELSGGNNVATELQRGSTQDSIENVEASDASWQFVNSNSTHLSQLSPFQQKHQGFLGDRIKHNASSVNISKTVLSHGTLSSSVSTPVESVPIPPIPKSANLPTAVSSSSGFLRSSRNLTTTGMLRQPSYGTGFGAALNIETLVAAAERRDTPIETPAPEIQDKILFMINNISSANVESKAKEFTEVLNEQYYPWFAQYMVMKRASIEPNFHDLYLKFLEKVNSKALNAEIIKATYENCKALLRSDLIKSSSEERSLLKNVGSWLGKFTIGRNQMLLAREIDPKSLIIEAYEKGKMIAVIPFTSKVLEPCHTSIAYRPPNPWTMGILGLLTEIYNLPNLKMNLKFDIEVLFKNLQVDMKDVKPSCLLKDRIREVEGNPDFSTKEIIVPQPPVMAEVNSSTVSAMAQAELKHEVNNIGHPNSKTQYAAPLHPVPTPMIEEAKGGQLVVPERVPSAQGLTQVAASQAPFAQDQLLPIIPNSESYIKINPKLMTLGPQVHRIMQTAMDKAVSEIVSPVIQRSVTIASRTTKELVLKDYAMETDENVVSRAARLMAATLAGSLAHVTCKEPLRVALSNHLRIYLQTFNVNNDYMDHIVQILINENLDLGCAVIENVASEKAVELIDGEIGPAFAALREQREATGSTYFEAAMCSQGPFSRVPEALRPKPGRLSAGQLRVYSDFITNIWQNQSSQSSSVVPSTYGLSSGQLNSNMYSTPQVVPGFNTSQSLDSMQEEADHTPSQIRASDGAELGSTVSSFPPNVATPELHVIDSSAVNKDVGNVAPRPTTPSSEHIATLSEPLLTTGDALNKYHSVVQKLEILVAKDSRDTRDAEVQGVISEVPDFILKCINRDEARLAIAQKIFKSLYENSSNSVLTSTYLSMLAAICESNKFLVKELTEWLIFSEEEQKLNIDVTIGLIRFELVNLADYSVHLVKLIDGGRNKAAMEFSISLVQTLIIHGVNLSDMHNVIDALGKITSPESLQQLVEAARNNTANVSSLAKFIVNKDDKLLVRDRPQKPSNREDYSIADSAPTDPSGFREQVTILFSEWCRICEVPATGDATYNHYLSQLHQNGFLKCDENMDRFWWIITELSVAHCLNSEQAAAPVSLALQSTQQFQHLSYAAIDAYSKLIVSVFKYPSMDQVKVPLLTKALLVTMRIIQKDAEERKSNFNPRPYFRLFINWIIDLTSDPSLEALHLQILILLANAFHALQPLKVPGFSFAWLELVSHKSYMPKLLNINQPKGWPFFQRLLVDLFKFIEPYLRNAELGKPVYFLYKGTLRVLLVLLHDFPEFLCEYHFSFCDVIPPSCIQMRNVILSAFPRNMRLPDPSTPNLKIDLLPEILQPPRIQSDVDSALRSKQLKTDVDEFLKAKTENSSFLTELKQKLLLPQNEANQAGTRYNVPLINSLVLYVGMQAIQQIQSKPPAQQQMLISPPMDNFLVGAAMDIYQYLVANLDSEGRYLFFNAVANQLRYPNNHTHYFSFVLLYIFAEAKQQENIQEQITRVLLERLIVNRPHPWGLLITFIELIKNPRYSFWSKSFTRCAPEIEKLFESVSRTCGGSKGADDSMVSGIPDVNH